MARILGIESSCDDTAASVVDSDKNILSNIVLSQLQNHAPYKGVVPEIAARAHIENLHYVVSQALDHAKVSLYDIDAIAATTGPGLIGGVIISTMFGKSLAYAANKKFIAINHLEGHALTARLTHDLDYPYLLLLVSGGHCQFINVSGLGHYQILGKTLDDAVGEAFDKVAKMLNLGYPGGPIIEQLAAEGDPYAYQFPKSMIERAGCDMSFSGLKTAVRRAIEEVGQLDDMILRNICASFQYIVGEILKHRAENAIKIYLQHHQNANRLVVSGGVAANLYLRNILSEVSRRYDFSLVAPPPKLCTDNAAMIAWAGMERFQAGLISDFDVAPKARWSLEDL